MANFYAYDFMYDDIPSQKFDLKIITFEDGGLFNGIGSSDVNILTQRVLRKSKPYYLGRTQEPVLEFPLVFGRASPVSGMDRDIISAWLFGRAEYKKLYILQDDLNGAYFNCFMTKPEPLYIGNVNYAFQCTVVCDSPWAYSPEKIVSGSATLSAGQVYPIDIYNSSSEDEYLYPTIHFIADVEPYFYIEGGEAPLSFMLVNVTDSSREFAFYGLIDDDEVTVNNDLQIITSSRVDPTTVGFVSSSIPGILNSFNKNWFRLLPRHNHLELQTSAQLFEIRYTERLKIGG